MGEREDPLCAHTLTGLLFWDLHFLCFEPADIMDVSGSTTFPFWTNQQSQSIPMYQDFPREKKPLSIYMCWYVHCVLMISCSFFPFFCEYERCPLYSRAARQFLNTTTYELLCLLWRQLQNELYFLDCTELKIIGIIIFSSPPFPCHIPSILYSFKIINCSLPAGVSWFILNEV